MAAHHPVFQLADHGHHVGADPESRALRQPERYDGTVEFCELYDENCFDVRYRSLPLEEFASAAARQVRSNAPRRDSPDL